jgi:hypothetical protein
VVQFLPHCCRCGCDTALPAGFIPWWPDNLVGEDLETCLKFNAVSQVFKHPDPLIQRAVRQDAQLAVRQVFIRHLRELILPKL